MLFVCGDGAGRQGHTHTVCVGMMYIPLPRSILMHGHSLLVTTPTCIT